jgi:hypothetical protein
MGRISRKYPLYFLAFFFSSVIVGFADEQGSFGNTSTFDSKKQQFKPLFPDSRTNARLQFESALYPEPLPGTPLQQMNAVFFNLTHSSHSEIRTGIDFASGHYTNLPSSFFYLNEAYFGKQISTSTRIDLGRKRESWAEFDNDWFLGLWEPRANWDPLRPFDQGLAGVFLHSNIQDFDFLFFTSPLFIPTVGPEIAEKNGSLVSQSRWYRSPVKSGLVLDRQTQFFYSLELPEMAKLAQQPSIASRLSYRLGQDGFWYSAGLARKPVNSLSIQYDYNLAVTSSFSRAEVRVTPNVSFHDLATFEMGWQGEAERFVVSFFADSVSSPIPVNQIDAQGNSQTDWIQQNPSNASGGAVKIEARRDLPFLNNPVEFSLSYLNTNSEISVDRDASGQVRGALFPDRFNWSNAVQTHIRTQTSIIKKQLNTQVRWMREFRQSGTLFSIQNSLNLNPQLAIQLNADVIGVDDSSTSNSSPGFFNQFRTNDRIYGGISYVF